MEPAKSVHRQMPSSIPGGPPQQVSPLPYSSLLLSSRQEFRHYIDRAMNASLLFRHYTLPWALRSCSFFSLAAISSASFSAFRALPRVVSTVDSDECSFSSWLALSRRWLAKRRRPSTPLGQPSRAASTVVWRP